jgi:hypothetical protein
LSKAEFLTTDGKSASWSCEDNPFTHDRGCVGGNRRPRKIFAVPVRLRRCAAPIADFASGRALQPLLGFRGSLVELRFSQRFAAQSGIALITKSKGALLPPNNVVRKQAVADEQHDYHEQKPADGAP